MMSSRCNAASAEAGSGLTSPDECILWREQNDVDNRLSTSGAHGCMVGLAHGEHDVVIIVTSSLSSSSVDLFGMTVGDGDDVVVTGSFFSSSSCSTNSFGAIFCDVFFGRSSSLLLERATGFCISGDGGGGSPRIAGRSCESDGRA
jgi:hypothetical protein